MMTLGDTRARRWLTGLGLSGAYVAAGYFGISQISLPPGNLTLLWLASGVGLIAYMSLGHAAIPWVALASFVVNAPYIVRAARFDSLLPPILLSILAAGGDTAQSFVAWRLARRLEQRLKAPLLSHNAHVLPFFLWICVVPPMLTVWITVWASTIGVAGPTSLSALAHRTLTVTTADALGLLLVGPLYWAWQRRATRAAERLRQPLPVSLLLVVTLGLSFVWQPALAMAAFPLLLIAGHRGHLWEVALQTLATAAVLAVGTANGLGPYGSLPGSQSFFALTIYLLALTFVAYSATLTHGELITHQDTLKAQVVARTAELATANLKLGREIEERRRAEDSLRASEAELRRKTDFLALLIDIGTALMPYHDTPALLQTIVDYAAHLTDMGSAAAYFLEGDTLQLQATYPALPPDFPTHLRGAPLADHPHIGRTLATMAPVVLPDAQTAELSPAEREVADTRDLRSQLYVPLGYQDRRIGVLIVGSVGHVYPFSQEEIDAYRTLAVQASLQIEEARLFDENRRHIADLQATLEQEERTRAKLAESETMLRLIFENAFDGINIYEELPDSRARRLVDCNQRYAEMAGRSKAELLEMGNPTQLQTNLGPQRSAEEKLRLRSNRIAYQGLVAWNRPDGKRNIVEYTAAPVILGERRLTVGIDRDITDRIRAEEELQAYADHLEDLVAARTQELEAAQARMLTQARLATLGQVAGSIAHELRTPLGAIKNATYLISMLQNEPDEALHEAVQIVNQAIGTADRIISSLLSFARPQQPIRQIVRVGRIAEDAIARLQPVPGIETTCQIERGLPEVLADPTHIRQILNNLLLNAVQAMPDGGKLAVEVTRCATLPEIAPPGIMPEGQDGDQPAWIAISVADTGTGISPAAMAHLFEPLFTTKVTGTGLGLALVKLLTSANGGGIAVESTAGSGATFRVYLPAAGDPAPTGGGPDAG